MPAVDVSHVPGKYKQGWQHPWVAKPPRNHEWEYRQENLKSIYKQKNRFIAEKITNSFSLIILYPDIYIL